MEKKLREGDEGQRAWPCAESTNPTRRSGVRPVLQPCEAQRARSFPSETAQRVPVSVEHVLPRPKPEVVPRARHEIPDAERQIPPRGLRLRRTFLRRMPDRLGRDRTANATFAPLGRHDHAPKALQPRMPNRMERKEPGSGPRSGPRSGPQSPPPANLERRPTGQLQAPRLRQPVPARRPGCPTLGPNRLQQHQPSARRPIRLARPAIHPDPSLPRRRLETHTRKSMDTRPRTSRPSLTPNAPGPTAPLSTTFPLSDHRPRLLNRIPARKTPRSL